MVNGGLIGLWFFTGASFFWPFFPIFFWGMGLVAQGVEYYNKYGPGAAKMDNLIEEEVNRELGRLTYAETRIDKSKNADNRLSTDYSDAPVNVRLTEDGELTDSFISEKMNRR